MDPTIAWQTVCDPARSITERREALAALWEWVNKGGYYPAGMSTAALRLAEELLVVGLGKRPAVAGGAGGAVVLEEDLHGTPAHYEDSHTVCILEVGPVEAPPEFFVRLVSIDDDKVHAAITPFIGAKVRVTIEQVER
jgi:hypothetical protein